MPSKNRRLLCENSAWVVFAPEPPVEAVSCAARLVPSIDWNDTLFLAQVAPGTPGPPWLVRMLQPRAPRFASAFEL